ncbi:MAG: DUF4426 domain-containing protein [Hydrogenophaga sp.]|uniref:DUF4426 domain-containing protein n=1 Tax=Hydrogenophaga sp. TaxID=1904254 RepID=UPI0016AFD52E|nr:DUF4426 domain-containing protein [Hydrogenophaga sp.]NIM39885.1 DUF4426 domain-containing protein [Hydrogenophaga sp.]NIN25081.1 DUF4426 domain-containing protein [Hydrogenophaga sp.]NIN29648.1 DUF4426 domain-containing protein [Hydrogenophaga sp.]NIN54120.1 DUF4426 domain-containing protein [Hydrogenophaga sp.]NIO50533.1 DUF4426 domain-containing protein [Hydrogenophaga sp.]
MKTPSRSARWWRDGARGLAVLACAAGAALALAQPHAVRHGDFTLQSSVVSSLTIAEETARQHGITPAEHTAVLNVVVLRDVGEARWPIAAAVDATRTTLAGVQQAIALREVASQGRVSYVGSFRFTPREVLDFSVSARIDPASPPLRLGFRERMPPTQLPTPSR